MDLGVGIKLDDQGVAHFGRRVLARYLGTLGQVRMTIVAVPNGDRIHVRADESVAAFVRQTIINESLSSPPQLRVSSAAPSTIQQTYDEVVASCRTPIIATACELRKI
jgi:hypothetical protein